MTSRSGTLAAIIATVTAVFALSPSGGVSADPSTDGFWYFDALNIQAAHDAGFTGAGITIAVFDSQINLEAPTLQGANIEVRESSCYDDAGTLIPPTTTTKAAQHGTNVLSYLVGSGAGYEGQPGVKGIAPEAKIIFTLMGADSTEQQNGTELICNPKEPNSRSTTFADGAYAAIDARAAIISMSVASPSSAESEVALANALHEGIVVLGGVNNDRMSGASFGQFPSGMNGVVGVQSMDANGNVQGGHADPFTDVVGAGVDVVWQGDNEWEQQRYASGTSIATPMVAGFLALTAQKYPEATGNQLVQTLIRNTGVEDHPINFDAESIYGFGVASATHMLRVDPTQYEDVNPLISDDPTSVPSAAAIASPPTLDEYLEREPSAAPGDEEPPPGENTFPALPMLLGGLGLLVVAGLVISLIVVIRSRRSSAQSGTSSR